MNSFLNHSFLTTAFLFSIQSLAISEDKIFESSQPKAEGNVAFVEGPAWHPSGNVYFSDGGNNRIMRFDPKGNMHIFRTPSGMANGLLFDRKGRLIACEGNGQGGNRRVTRTEANGTITVLTNKFKGKRYNAPNDLTIDSKNRIYFTDPRYGARDDLEIFDKEGTAVEGVYRIDPDGTVDRIISHEVDRPNGIAVSQDDKYLYVVDNNNSTKTASRKLWRFELNSDGTIDPKSRKMLYDFKGSRGGDGMALDQEGRLYVAGGLNMPSAAEDTVHKGGVFVFTPEGERISFIRIYEDEVTNCTFGGDELKTLYITAGHKLFSVRVTTPGFVPSLDGK